MPIVNRKHGRVEFFDQGNSIGAVTFGPGEGNFTLNDMQGGQTEAVAIMDRGSCLELVEGNQTFPTVAITLHVQAGATSTTARTVLDAILKTGTYANATTADPGGVVWTGNLRFVTDRAGVIDTYTCNNVRIIASLAEGENMNTYSISGTVYGGYTRS
jgi:hypothetical protein